MKDAMISVRMPLSMIQELKELAQENHYVDLSEQLRDILRVKCNKYISETVDNGQRTQYSETADKTRTLNADNGAQAADSDRSSQSADKARLVLELSKIVEELKKGL